jgi:pimeloyl-ACP methyl ester carboxylesterase
MSRAGAALLTSGCIVRPTNEPMRRIAYPSPRPYSPDTLVVLLPGWGDRARDFQRHGFIDAMRAAGIDADVVAVDVHSGCCWRRKLARRIELDVIERARSEGYTSIWLAGISMGGQGALLTAERFDDVDGVVLLSPWLGAHPIVTQIEASGGLRAWTPPPTRRDPMTRVWSWLGEVVRESARPLYLACGADERWRSITLLVEALPAEHVVVAPGGHDWPTWRRAWPELLVRGAFARGHVSRRGTRELPAAGHTWVGR